jgi:hypothetical protein
MKDIDLLLPRVLEKAPACPEPSAIRHIRDAAIEFSRRTRIWRETNEFVIDPEGEDDIIVGADRAVFEISHARFADVTGDSIVDLDPRTIDWLDENEHGWRDQTGQPKWITQTAPDTVRIAPMPDASGTLTLETILVSSNNADQLPDILIDVYGKVIADGALGTLLMLPADFGNPQLAQLHAALFEQAIGHWADHIPLGQQRSKRRVKSHYF